MHNGKMEWDIDTLDGLIIRVTVPNGNVEMARCLDIFEINWIVWANYLIFVNYLLLYIYLT